MLSRLLPTTGKEGTMAASAGVLHRRSSPVGLLVILQRRRWGPRPS